MFSKLALGIQRPGLLSNSHRIKYIEVWSFQKNMYWYSVIVVAVKKMLLRGPIYYMYLHVVSCYFCCQKILVEFLNYKPGIEITFILPVDSTWLCDVTCSRVRILKLNSFWPVSHFRFCPIFSFNSLWLSYCIWCQCSWSSLVYIK